jgi:hypothetical protein
VVNQFYDAEITKEYVMRGNSAIIKCLIPSFVADFVQVVAWINEDKEEIIPAKDFSGGKERKKTLLTPKSHSTFCYDLFSRLTKLQL